MWSLERYIIGKDCELRLALTGTISKTTPITAALRRGIILGKLPPMPLDIDHTSVQEVFLHILNTRRKADYTVPVCTRVYWDENGTQSETGFLRVIIDFATIKDNVGEFFYVTCKKMGGTPPVSQAYSIIGASLKYLYPHVEHTRVREIMLLPMHYSGKEGAINRYELALTPPQLIDISDETIETALSGIFKMMDKYSSRSDIRKCRVSTDPCPAYGICQVSNGITH